MDTNDFKIFQLQVTEGANGILRYTTTLKIKQVILMLILKIHGWDTNNFKIFQLQVTEGANGILRYKTIAILLKYLSNFWISLEMLVINCKVELKCFRG